MEPVEPTPDTIASDVIPEGVEIAVPCGAAAPIVANGATFIGCQSKKNHEGPHSITIKWE